MADWSIFCQVLFELSNENRLSIIMKLLEEPSTVTEVAKRFQLTTQEASRHLARLLASGIVIRDSNGDYSASQYGRLMYSTLRSQQFISQNRDYFLNHDASHIPEEFQSRFGELLDSTYVDDVMAVFQKIQEMIDDAEEYIWRLTDRRFNLAYPNLQSAAERGVDFKLIETLNYQRVPDVNQTPRVSPSETRGLESIPVFIAMSEKEIASLAFPNKDQFDYRGFTSTSEKSIEWCKNLFQHYWEKALVKI